LITMAPFAVLAPVIGPVLDRLQHGRRWALAATALGRAGLAVAMAFNFDTLLVLFPLALGSLVLSKAYGVLRASVVPYLAPASLTLVSVNARLSIFGLAASVLGGGFMAGLLAVTHSYPAGLCVAAFAFLAPAYYALRLPRQLDASTSPQDQPDPATAPRSTADSGIPDEDRKSILGSFGPHAAVALLAEFVLRWGAGFLTIFLAFYIEQTSRGFNATAALAGVVLGGGFGQLIGTVSGARIKVTRPEVLVMVCMVGCAASFAVTAVTFSLTASIICMAATSATNSLGKVSLDAVIQRDVMVRTRSRVFARSETILQLAWVLGATVALLVPITHAQISVGGGSVVLVLGALGVILRARSVQGRVS
jgi:MFS family permease